MSPFLRWGIFAIVAVAALWYAYNASKDVTERPPKPPLGSPSVAGGTAAQPPPLSAVCQVELTVAMNARAARANGDPLDRLLRTQEIAFESDPARRDRLTGIARRWFEIEGDVDPTMLRSAVSSECEQVTQSQPPPPAPEPEPEPAPVTTP